MEVWQGQACIVKAAGRMDKKVARQKEVRFPLEALQNPDKQ
jgi:hypothetical protein